MLNKRAIKLLFRYTTIHSKEDGDVVLLYRSDGKDTCYGLAEAIWGGRDITILMPEEMFADKDLYKITCGVLLAEVRPLYIN